MIARSVLVLLMTAAVASPLSSRTVRWTISTPEDYQRGTLENIVVASTGELTLGPALARKEAGDLTVWCSAADPKSGAIYFGTATEGRILVLDAKKEIKEVAKTGELAVTALAFGPGGKLYAATIPGGKVFAVDTTAGKAEVHATLKEKEKDDVYIWSLAASGDALLAGTGPDGRIYRIAGGKASVWAETKQSHVLSLAVGAGGDTYAGTSPAGVLFRVDGDGKGEVVFNTEEQEIRSLAWDRDVLWIGANKSKKFDPKKFVKRLQAAAAQAQQGDEKESPFQELFDGSIYRMTRGNPARLVHSLPKSYIASVVVDKAGSVYAGTGDEGMVWRFNPDGTRSLLAKLKESQAMTLAVVEGSLAAIGTGNPGTVQVVEAGAARSGSFTSEIVDARFPATWGTISWDSTGPLSVQTRSGKTARPDDGTWSDWSEALKGNPGKVASPVGRYFQARVGWTGDAKAALRWLTLYYKTENQQPDLKEVEVESFDEAQAFLGKARDSAEVSIRWKAADADGDELSARLYVQREGREDWAPLIPEPTSKKDFKWDTRHAADGVYRVKVVVSDEPANPGEAALSAVKVTRPILVDNHKPEFDGGKFDKGSLSITVKDDASVVARVEVSVDAGPWQLALPIDGIYDHRVERFTIALPKDNAPVRHVSVRAFDGGGNVAVWQESFKGQ